MKDQGRCIESGGRVRSISEQFTDAGAVFFKALDFARKGKYKIIYVAPERL